MWGTLSLFTFIYNGSRKFPKYSFFIYSCHYYIEPCVSKILLLLLPISISGMYINNILAVVITLSLSFALGIVLKKSFPKFYNLLTGSR